MSERWAIFWMSKVVPDVVGHGDFAFPSREATLLAIHNLNKQYPSRLHFPIRGRSGTCMVCQEQRGLYYNGFRFGNLYYPDLCVDCHRVILEYRNVRQSN